MIKMEAIKLVEYFKAHEYKYEYLGTEYNGKNGLIVRDKILNTETFLSYDAIRNCSIEQILLATEHAQHVKQATRITGFFSYVEGWNAGKRGELKSRFKNHMDGNITEKPERSNKKEIDKVKELIRNNGAAQ